VDLFREKMFHHLQSSKRAFAYVGINSVGLRRRGFTRKIRGIYRILYQKIIIPQALGHEAEMEATQKEMKSSILLEIHQWNERIFWELLITQAFPNAGN
jgi:acyl-[acyl carrier protein]--UDP-N-acetylglucosamine O-acyltransferase